jgi:hypothetical protein
MKLRKRIWNPCPNFCDGISVDIRRPGWLFKVLKLTNFEPLEFPWTDPVYSAENIPHYSRQYCGMYHWIWKTTLQMPSPISATLISDRAVYRTIPYQI